MNVSAPLRRNARLMPEAAAFVRNDATTVSFARMERTVDALAHHLQRRGCAAGRAVAVATSDAERFLFLCLALARIGVAVAPPGLLDAEVMLFAGDDPAQGGAAPAAVSLDELFAEAATPCGEPVPLHADPGAVFAYCASSGTTASRPKIVPFTHELLYRRLAMRVLAAPTMPGSRHASLVGPTAVFGLQRSLRTLWTGCAVVEPNLDAERMAEWLVATQVSAISLTPIALRRMLECLPPSGVQCALALLEVGAGLLPRSLREWTARVLPGAVLLATYGSTETGGIAASPMAALGDRAGAVGFPFADVDVDIVDDDERPLPPGHEGRVRVRSAHAATHYHDNAALSAQVFRDGWVYTNDVGIQDADGALRLMGRADDVINCNGVKVHPQAIEDVLLTLADLREVAVFGAPDAQGLVVLCAAIVPNRPINAQAFHERCRARLKGQAPVFIMHVEALPRNAMGKVLRTELARRALAAQPSGASG